MPHIKFYIDKNIVEPIAVEPGTTFGRSEEATIVLLDYQVSSIHAVLLQEGTRYYLKNLVGSPFLINRQAVREQSLLKTGDEIFFGTKRLVFFEQEHLWPEDVFLVDLTQKHFEEYPVEKLKGYSDLLFRCFTEEIALSQIEHLLPEILGEHQVDPLVVMNLEAVLHESLNNAARHGHQYQKEKLIHLYFRLTSEEVQFTVIDEGAGFDYAFTLDQSLQIDAVTAARNRYQAGGYGGLGFIMMLKCLDRIEFNIKGNWVTLIKKRN